ncbi:hypothetical protein [Nakamurella sp.]|uniref:hypothetical protein n=1 Tax=Nakamurella sp. TaxID=1869182 RepID=UPI003784489B
MATTTWPDGAMFQACAQHPDRHFTDPALRTATFEPDRRRGGIQAWSGGRATVIRANRGAGGPVAVRLSRQADDEAGARYLGLSRFLATCSLDFLVSATWQENGLRLGADHFPILTMDWVPGTSLDNYLSGTLAGRSATAIAGLAAQWQAGCRALAQARLGHGDVHAGNTMVSDLGGGQTRLRLVDYDSVWYPGSTAPARETGHPAFTHPRRSELPPGPAIDAFPNTLTYLSLIALAVDPGLWTHHRVDDGLLFDRADLLDPTRPVWVALLASADRDVASLARTTLDWVTGPPDRHGSLDQAIGATGSRGARVNVWPPRPAPGSLSPADRPPRAGFAGASRTLNTWPARPAGSPAGPAGHAGARKRPAEAGATRPIGANTWIPAGKRPASTPNPPNPANPPNPSTGGELKVLLTVLAVLVVLIALGVLAAQ